MLAQVAGDQEVLEDAITAELLDIVSGYEALRANGGLLDA